ncbi:MFS transporter [Streptomyces varsoviensis]|nr:MFS transporter [Streptomyces varsoviensis]
MAQETAPPELSADVTARLDRLPVTRHHRSLVITIGMGLFFDMYEIFMSGVLGPVLSDRFELSATATSAVLASAFIGMFLGVVTMGRLADRYGRRRFLIASVALYTVFSAVGALSLNAPMLIAARFLAGLGIGPQLPLADAYLSDLLPARARGRYTALAYTIAFFGVPTVGLLAHWLVRLSPLGMAGWRWLFLIGALGGVAALLRYRRLVESPRWLASVGRTAEAERIVTDLEAAAPTRAAPPAATARTDAPAAMARTDASAAAARTAPPAVAARTAASSVTPATAAARRMPRVYRRRAAMMGVFHLLQSVGFYGFGTMAPLVLDAKGFSIVHSLLFSALTYFGYPLGSLISLPIIERFERKHLIVVAALAMAAFGVAFGQATNEIAIVVSGVGYTAVSNVFSNAYHVYQAEIFPTELRATATSWTYAMSRVSTAAMPFALVPVLHAFGAARLFAAVAAVMTVIALEIGVLGPTANGRSAEAEAEAEAGAGTGAGAKGAAAHP